MSTERISLVTNLDPEVQGSGSVVLDKSQGSINLLYSTYPDGRPYVETRASLVGYARDGETRQPRGCYYWEEVGALVIATSNRLLRGDYGNDIGAITLGKDRVFFIEYNNPVGGKFLFVNDAENNKWWKITTAFALTDETTNLPADLQSVGIAGGGTEMDGFLFLMSKDGRIYHSNVNDPDTWDANNVIPSGRSPDGGIFLAKQGENIVSFGSASTEFFYNAANPAGGSTLNRRNDLAYNTGAINYNCCVSAGSYIFFIGSTSQGTVGAYVMENMKLDYISHDTVDAWLNDTLLQSGFNYQVSAATIGEHKLAFFTAVRPTQFLLPFWEPIFTVIYDLSTRTWGTFRTGLFTNPNPSISQQNFPVVDTASRYGTGRESQTLQLSNSMLCTFVRTDLAQDTFSQGAYVTEDGTNAGAQDYIETQNGYIQPVGDDEIYPITIQLVTDVWDNGIYTSKIMPRMAIVGKNLADPPDLSVDMTICWTDDHYTTYSNPRPLSTLMDRKLTRLGKFQRRAFKIDYTGTNRLRMENIEVTTRGAEYR